MNPSGIISHFRSSEISLIEAVESRTLRDRFNYNFSRHPLNSQRESIAQQSWLLPGFSPFECKKRLIFLALSTH